MEWSAKVYVVISENLREAGWCEKEMAGKKSHRVGFGYANSQKLRLPFPQSFDSCTC